MHTNSKGGSSMVDAVFIGIKRGAVGLFLLFQLFTTFLMLTASITIVLNESGYFPAIGPAILLVYLFAGGGAALVGSILGAITGASVTCIKKSGQASLAALIGGLLPLVCSLPFRVPFLALRQWYIAAPLILTCLLFAFIARQIYNERFQQNPYFVSDEPGVETIARYILQAQKTWNSSRFDIDRALIAQGHAPLKIENAWKAIQSEQVWLDEAGVLRMGTPFVKKATLLDKLNLEIWQIALYIMVVHCVTIFVTPLVLVPIAIITAVLLVVRYRELQIIKSASKISV
jgi:hypothetical protein